MSRNTAALALLCIASPLAAQSFEGIVSMNVTGDNGKAATMTYMLKDGKMRFDPSIPDGRGGQQVSVIIDPATQRMTVIMNAQKMYMERDFSGATSSMAQQATGKRPEVVRTGKFETIAGYKCEDVTVTDDDGKSVDTCISSELGGFRMPAASNPMAPQREAGWVGEIGSRSFPLKVVKDGKTLMEVTSIDKKSLDASLFAPPAGFQSFQMPTMPKKPIQ